MKRDELHKQIKQEEEEKNKVQNDLRILTEKLAKINESLAKKIATRNEYDKTISETEAAYMKVFAGNKFLLQIWLKQSQSQQTNISNKILYTSMKENCYTKI